MSFANGLLLGWVIAFFCTQPLVAQFTVQIDIEKAPFHYSQTPDNNRVSRLADRINNQEIQLEYTHKRGYLRSLLDALEISESSQTLVFSKTSMQVQHISRRNPRAIYFNDDTYVGWVNGSSLAEVSTFDPKLGAAFYAVEMSPRRPEIQQATYDCLACHATSMTQGIPGHTVRSVMPAWDGSINSQLQSFVTSDASPFSERWGGWYVTGNHGGLQHMGNSALRGGKLDTSQNANLKNLREQFDTSNYLSPYSDIVALMVLEHQTQMHNAMARANFFVRKLRYDAGESGAKVDDPELKVQLSLIAGEVVERFLFCNETKLSDAVVGSVVFEEDFQRRGAKDTHGRSLRDFDLKTRIFKYPCSYLIYSEAFATLEPNLRSEIVRQIRDVLKDNTNREKFAHLTTTDRESILEILIETHPDF